MGSPVPTEEPMGDPMADPMGGAPEANDKPFDDEPFEAGVEANEEENPEKYIQQLSGKLGQSLRKYTDSMGQPDYDLEKFAINSVLSATNSGEMDQQDQNDIIQKVKNSSTDGSGGDGEDAGMPDDGMPDEEPTGGEEDLGDEELDFSEIDMEEGHNPNPNGKTVFQDMTLGVKDGGMEENKYLNLENTKKSSIFVSENETIKDMIRQTLNEAPVVIPETKPSTAPTRTPSRRSKPWTPRRIEEVPNPEPKGEVAPITFVSADKFTENDVVITFDVGDVRFVETFTNTGEDLVKPMSYDEPWVYKFETEPLSNNKIYNVAVDFYGNPTTNLELDGFNGNNTNVAEIEES